MRTTFYCCKNILHFYLVLWLCESAINLSEYVTNDWAKDEQDSQNNHGYQNEDQSIFYETLAFFFR